MAEENEIVDVTGQPIERRKVKRRIKQRWQEVKTLQFYTYTNTPVRVGIFRGTVDLTEIVVIRKFKQWVALLKGDVPKLIKALQKIMEV